MGLAANQSFDEPAIKFAVPDYSAFLLAHYQVDSCPYG
jgi:hypothetical protein